MDPATVATVASRYPWASWAVWDDPFPDGDCVERHPERLVEFVRERADLLTPDIVLLGLNRSGDLSAPFENFHAPTRRHYDYRLKETIQDDDLDRLHGAYMTDLVDEVDPDSHGVTVTDADVALLLEQPDLFDAEEYHVVCFGNKPFDGLVGYFDAETTAFAPEIRHARVRVDGSTLYLYRVRLYGLYGANQHKVPVFREQLRTLNEQLA